MSEHAINGFMGISMEKIRSVVDANTMIGDPIQCGDGTTVIPVSKVSLGFASGGSDIPTRTAKEYFAGGAGAGLRMPFACVYDGAAGPFAACASQTGRENEENRKAGDLVCQHNPAGADAGH